MKKCIKCHIEKPAGSFFKNRLTKDGLRPSCKSCESQLRAQKAVNVISNALIEEERKRTEALRVKFYSDQKKLMLKIKEIKRAEFLRLTMITNSTGTTIRSTLIINKVVAKYEALFGSQCEAEKHLEKIYNSPLLVARGYRNKLIKGEL